MNVNLRPGRVITALALTVLFASAASAASMLTRYPDSSSFASATASATDGAASGFDEFESGTSLSTGWEGPPIPGVYFSTDEGHAPVVAAYSPFAVSYPNVCTGGGAPIGVPGFAPMPQVIRLVMVGGVNAVRFSLTGLRSGAPATVTIYMYAGESSLPPETFAVSDTDGDMATPEFFGVTSGAWIGSVEIQSGADSEGAYPIIGLDDLAWAIGDFNPPVCSGSPGTVGGLRVVGYGTEYRAGDTGIAGVELDESAVNLSLVVEPFEIGSPYVTFTITQSDPASDGTGRAIVTDLAGHECLLPVNLLTLPPGPLDRQLLAWDEGVLLEVSNANDLPGGPYSSSIDDPDAPEPTLPAGYSWSPADDPYPCRVISVQAPITGLTDMIYKKDGVFDPRLRLMLAVADDTGAFGPFHDVTETISSIADVVPDPTRLTGAGTWPPTPQTSGGFTVDSAYSNVKVACAIQTGDCTGVAPVDADSDGFQLCPADARPADCNDEIARIHPGADEICNGLDDNCDGAIDEGNPGGGAECTVPGMRGACAVGRASCTNGGLECEQVEFSPATPVVTLAPVPALPIRLPRAVPFSSVFTVRDPDGPTGQVIHEVVFLDRCLLWDGNTYGPSPDGLLTGDVLPLDRDTFCAALATCGQDRWTDPVIRVEATDCGGHTGFAEQVVRGSYGANRRYCDAMRAKSGPRERAQRVDRPGGRLTARQ